MGHRFRNRRCLSSNVPFGSKKLKMAENTEAQKMTALQIFFSLNYSKDT